jgi:SSS family solute:Na+ symporter
MKTAILSSYMLILVSIGYIGMRKTRDLNDFVLAGRSVGPWVSAFAYGTTYFSAVIFIGYAGKTGWGFGTSAVWVAIGNSLIGSFLAWKVLAHKTREITKRLNARTMPEFLEARYQSPGLKVFSAAVIFIFLVPYSASVYMGLSYLFEGVFNIPYTVALVFIAVFTAIYLTMGGYFAVNLTDFFQGSIMLVGAFLMVAKIAWHPKVGGVFEGLKRLAEIDPKLASPVGPPGFWPLFFLVMLTSLGPWGLPQMVQKFYSIKDTASIKPATVVTTIFSLVISVSAYYMGSLSRLFFNEMPTEAGVPNPDLIIPEIIRTTMPEIFAVIILALVLSASMSSLSSLVLVSSSAVSIDLIQGRLFPGIKKEKIMLIMRSLCVLFILLSLVIALAKPAIILTLMAVSWGTVAGVFLAPYLYGLFWKGATRTGAWVASVSGLVISLGLGIYFKFDSSLIPMVGCLAMIIPLGILPVVSLFTGKLPEQHLASVFSSHTTNLK